MKDRQSNPIRPLSDRVLVKPRKEKEERTSGGLYVPDSARDKTAEGTVVAVGPGQVSRSGERIPVGVRPGDRVIFDSLATDRGAEIEVGDKKLLLISENDILAVVEGGAEKEGA